MTRHDDEDGLGGAGATGLSRTVVGRADLLRAISRDPGRLATWADLTGYEMTLGDDWGHGKAVGDESEAPQPGPPPPERDPTAPLAPVPFWMPVAAEWVEVGPGDTGAAADSTSAAPPTASVVDWQDTLAPQERVAARFRPLAPWRVIAPPLRRAATHLMRGKDLDVPDVVRRLSRAEPLDEIPRALRRTWGGDALLIYDGSRRLVPYGDDQALVGARLRRLLPRHGLVERIARDARSDDGDPAGPRPGQGGLVVVLGDLGCLAVDGDGSIDHWCAYGRRLLDAGVRRVALVPMPLDRVPRHVHRLWTVVRWDRHGATGGRAPLTIQRLLTLLSPAVSIETGLLRDVRLALGGDAALEAAFWQHPALVSASRAGATLDSDLAKDLREHFDDEPEADRRCVLTLIRRWRVGLPPELWYEEVLGLSARSQPLVPAADVAAAASSVAAYRDRIGRAADGTGSQLVGPWARRVIDRLPPGASEGGPQQALWRGLAAAVESTLPGGTPADVPSDSDPSPLLLVQQGGDLAWGPFDARPVGIVPSGLASSDGRPLSPLAILHSRNRIVHVDMPFWRAGPPPWAEDWGEDAFGPWVSFVVGGVRQRMRWISPGRFLMGSPEDEPGRYDDEGPRHEVFITRGFWLADTPCTQALWQAVMGENPSHFKSPQRPVEGVSWKNVDAFVGRMNERRDDLRLMLPTEAQWEYACRAGTASATYAGPMEIRGLNDAPVLDAIAWYGGNSGVDFDLAEGFDSSGWGEKQYEHTRAGTRLVGQKVPNAWGLYDMLGNVWEWCADGKRDYAEAGERDPVGAQGPGVARAVRGGGWVDVARFVRSARRYWVGPGIRDDSLGFRLARVQEGAEPVGAAEGREAEPRPERPRPSEATGSWRGRGGPRDARVTEEPLPASARISVTTDTAAVILQKVTRPRWAVQMARDHMGLWAEFQIDSKAAGAVVQRMRWIPPGRFLIGSPDDEPGRIDNEGPRHGVLMTRGFWLADTPCTQALWEAVMRENPSRFKSPQRPVERVSWERVRTFLQRINKRPGDLRLELPTEAQWEYACRAGTETATYAGPIEIRGANDAPVLDAIAWYGGNSGMDFDLPGGTDSSGWPDKQYEHTKAGTRVVGQKVPNPWGLYDMLGNVWEWCADGRREYLAVVARDPTGEEGPGVARAVRGGGWFFNARLVRSAQRYWSEPGRRIVNLGFRLARVQD